MKNNMVLYYLRFLLPLITSINILALLWWADHSHHTFLVHLISLIIFLHHPRKLILPFPIIPCPQRSYHPWKSFQHPQHWWPCCQLHHQINWRIHQLQQLQLKVAPPSKIPCLPTMRMDWKRSKSYRSWLLYSWSNVPPIQVNYDSLFTSCLGCIGGIQCCSKYSGRIGVYLWELIENVFQCYYDTLPWGGNGHFDMI